MNMNNFKCLKLFALVVTLPFVYGCAGAGTGSLLGFLFGSGLGIGDLALLGSGSNIVEGGAALATLHQPEPASMFLLGSGLATMTYFKSKSGRSKK